MTTLNRKKTCSKTKSWILYTKNYEIQQQKAFSSTYGNLFAYAANNPVKYTDPDGNQSIPFSLKDFLNLTSDPVNKIHNEMKLADSGDENSKAYLHYVFHEAGRETLKLASSTMNDMAVISLSLGCPEGTAVFGTISTACDFILTIDDFITGNIKQGIKDSIVLVAGVVFSSGTAQGAKTISKGINITVGKTGKYYELGTRGAIKSEKALRKMIMKDIASGYFGSEIVPNAKLVADEAVKAYKKIEDIENDK